MCGTNHFCAVWDHMDEKYCFVASHEKMGDIKSWTIWPMTLIVLEGAPFHWQYRLWKPQQ